MSSRLFEPLPLFAVGLLLRAGLLLYGLWHDSGSALKYTDIDYLVFVDAARAVSLGHSPYSRETYRYTPLLAWLLAPSTWLSDRLASVPAPGLSLLALSFGKVLFAGADLVAGWLLLRILRRRGRRGDDYDHDHDDDDDGNNDNDTDAAVSAAGAADAAAAGRLAALWLWNPMVATISTRGSSEGLLGMLVMGLLCATLERRFAAAGALLGLGVHFKIYPVIYGPAILWWMGRERPGGRRQGTPARQQRGLADRVWSAASPERITVVAASLGVFLGLNGVMYWIHGMPFLEHTYLHHVVRLDHRHNFSPYNVLLYLGSASGGSPARFRPESVAFVPQLLLSTVLIPIVGGLARTDLAVCMMAQTFAFVTFNKVCTSQYFLWYLVFLPLYLARSSFLARPVLGASALGLWVAAQAAWLWQAYQLEFGGVSTFLPGLWAASQVFFLVNCWILGIMVRDGTRTEGGGRLEAKSRLEGKSRLKAGPEGGGGRPEGGGGGPESGIGPGLQ